jgi:hypothetical protein
MLVVWGECFCLARRQDLASQSVFFSMDCAASDERLFGLFGEHFAAISPAVRIGLTASGQLLHGTAPPAGELLGFGCFAQTTAPFHCCSKSARQQLSVVVAVFVVCAAAAANVDVDDDGGGAPSLRLDCESNITQAAAQATFEV